MKSNRLLISFIGETGLGKSTASRLIINKIENSKIVKLAKPLYELQEIIYKKANVSITSQDGELLQFLGNKIQKINPNYLFEEFQKEIKGDFSVINDDCRPHNYKFLKDIGFVFVSIKGPSRLRNEDVSPIDKNNSVEWTDETLKNKMDFYISNEGNLNDLSLELDNLLINLINNKKLQN